MTSVIPAETCCLVMTDCCHSGSICDFSDPGWQSREAICMSGCTDAQTSGDTGRGGIFTHSLLMAIQELHDEDEDDYSIAQLYNKQLEKDDEVFNSEQDITIKWTAELNGPQDMAWPLIPEGEYQAPWGQ